LGGIRLYIEELQIEGFGPLAGVRLRFDAPATIIWGPNEAGKSTLLRFIRSMLYGFATRAQLAERGEPVGGGRHGGRLVLRDGSGIRVLERFADAPQRRGGPIAVLREADGHERQLAQSDIERLLLGGVSEQLFRQLYAVSLDELHELRSLQGDEIGNYLYHAGMAGGAALTSAGKRLRTEMDRLYRPKGAVQEIGALLLRIKELEGRLRQGRQELGAYMDALDRMQALNARSEELDRSLPALRARVAETEAALEAREWWLRASALRAEEEAIEREQSSSASGIGIGIERDLLPAEAAAEWQKRCERREAAAAEARRAAGEREALEAERAGLVWDERLLARADELAALDLRGEALEARRGERAGLESDIRLAEEAAAAALLRLGPGWREADAEAVAALSEREEARGIGERLSEEERRRELLAAETLRLRRQLTAFDLEADRREAGRGTARAEGVYRFLPASREALLRAWNRLDDALQAVESARRDYAWAVKEAEFASVGADGAPGSADVAAVETNEGEHFGDRRRAGGRSRVKRSGRSASDKGRVALTALLGAGAAGALAAAILASDWRALYAPLTAVLAAAAGASAWLGRRPGPAQQAQPGPNPAATEPIRRRLAAAGEREAETRRQAAEALRALLEAPDREAAAAIGDGIANRIGTESGPGIDGSGEFRMRLRDEVYRELDRLGEADAERERAEERTARREALVRELAGAEAELEEAEAAIRGVRAEWSAWLAARRLPLSLQPSALPELGQLAEQALQQLRQRARLKARAEALDAEREAFEAEAAALLAACPPVPHAGGDAALALKLLHREARQQTDTAAAARRLDERLRQAEAAETAALGALRAAEAAVSAVLDAAGAAGEDAYALRLVADERRRELRRDRREAELRLSAGRSEEERRAIVGLLESHDEAALRRLADRRREELAACEAERTQLLGARGRLSEQLERLRREAETEEKALELEELQAELDRLAERYALLALTAELIRRTRVTFEEERQPAVLRQASAYFAELTGGRYVRIAVPGDTPDLLAETADRRIVGSAFLSRGTQEQLYLALRLALAGAASGEAAMPLLLDDLFVHYDEARLERCAKLLNELARTRQIILFTCHRHVAEALAGGIGGSSLLKLPELPARKRDFHQPEAPEAAG